VSRSPDFTDDDATPIAAANGSPSYGLGKKLGMTQQEVRRRLREWSARRKEVPSFAWMNARKKKAFLAQGNKIDLQSAQTHPVNPEVRRFRLRARSTKKI